MEQIYCWWHHFLSKLRFHLQDSYNILRFYLDRGVKVYNVKEFIQYIPGKILLPFAEKVTKLRTEATYEEDDAKQLTAKLFGNSGKL